MKKSKYNVLAIADTQAPFEHQDYLKFLVAVGVKYGILRRPGKLEKNGLVIHAGDEQDQHTLGSFDPDPDGMSGGEELTAAQRSLMPYFEAFPDVKVCISNHTDRIFRKAFRHGIPRGYLKDYREFLKAPKGWEWQDKWTVDGVRYIHGEGYSGQLGALNAAKDAMKPTVIGHLHSDAGIQFWANEDQLLWGMNVGCGIDKSKYAFHYGKKLRRKPILSCGVILKGQPLLIPMWLDRRGRWTGKV